MTEQLNITGTPESETPSYPTHTPTKEQIMEHGFYYHALSEKERVFYELALASEGLEHEIALLKAKIEYFALIYPFNLSMMVWCHQCPQGPDEGALLHLQERPWR